MSWWICLAIPFIVLTFVLEAWVRRRRGQALSRRDGVTSCALGAGNVVINLALRGSQLALSVVLYDHRVIDLHDSVYVWILAFFADDFVSYWAHRLSHVIRFFWASHEVHHSSDQFTLVTALRQPWTHVPMSLLWAPLPLLGFRPDMVIAVHTVGLVYQYWIHTELIGKLGPLEFIFNTPSHHRVHHGSNLRYLDKNYGATLIVWDRIFGTFQVEDERPVYGLTKPLERHDLLGVAFHEWIAIARDLRHAESVSQALRLVFGHPGNLPIVRPRTAARAPSAIAPIAS